jgi:hypothetical protein
MTASPEHAIKFIVKSMITVPSWSHQKILEAHMFIELAHKRLTPSDFANYYTN